MCAAAWSDEVIKYNSSGPHQLSEMAGDGRDFGGPMTGDTHHTHEAHVT